jgi:hypothetical protein
MQPTDFLPYLSGPAAAVFVLVWVVWMLRRDLAELRKANEADRRRADAAEEAARTTNAILQGLLHDKQREPP